MTFCDIGNTTFSFFNKKKCTRYLLNVKYKNMPDFKGVIYFISVNQKGKKRFYKRYPNAIDLEKFINFSTKYKGIGIDRKLVCLSTKNGILVDAGSAVTIDIMKNGKHLGGFILPGIKNLIKLYPKISSKLKVNFEKRINLDKIPQNTNSAVNYAILQSLVQPIINICNRYDLPLVFTGGDAKYLIKYFKNTKYKKDLIFNIMKQILKEKGK
jgi:type III pantothenate kinase